jgi:hypothetical protein
LATRAPTHSFGLQLSDASLLCSGLGVFDSGTLCFCAGDACLCVRAQ